MATVNIVFTRADGQVYSAYPDSAENLIPSTVSKQTAGAAPVADRVIASVTAFGGGVYV